MLAADLIERLIDFAGADAGGDLALRRARRAMQDALRDFPTLHRWTYYYAHGRLDLHAPLNSDTLGTMSYDATTGQVTLDDNTQAFPSWAASADMRINDVVCRVATRNSDTVVTLDTSIRPFPTDLDAGTTFTIYEDAYILPADFWASDSLLAEERFGELRYVLPQNQLWAQRTAERVGVPIYYTFLPSDLIRERYQAKVWPYPDRDQTLDYIYSRRPRRVKYDGSSDAGVVTVASSSTAVTGVGTNFKSDMVGSVLRLAYDGTNPPTSTSGVNPAAFESVVTAVASATALTITDAADADYTSVRFVVSDALDFEEATMANCLCWRAKEHLAAEMQFKNLQAVKESSMQALIEAKDHDARSYARDTAGPGGFRRPDRRYMPTGPDEP